MKFPRNVARTERSEIREQVIALNEEQVDEQAVATALSAFDPVWEALAPREQTRLVQLIVERVDYDGANDKVSITFHPAGIKALADEVASQQPKEKIA